MGRIRRVVAVSSLAGLVLVLSACAHPATTAGPPPAPYAGPLWIAPDPAVDRWKDPGAAGKVVDCDFDAHVVGATSSDPFSGGEVGDTAAAALKEARDEGTWDGYGDMEVVREEPDRVLYGYAGGGRTLQAVIVRYGPAVDGTGAGADGLAWWVESWARCDVAEYPPEVTDDLDYEFWTDADGRRQPIRAITSYEGGDCVAGTHFLELGRSGGDAAELQVYVAHGEAFPDFFAEPYRADVDLPSDAVDTGFSREGDHLWLSPDQKRAYVGTAERVDLWPRTIQPLGCA